MTPSSRFRSKAPRRRTAGAPPTAANAWPDPLSQLAAIVEHSNEAVLSSTLDGVVTSWNPAAERIFGFRASEIIGRSSRVLLPRGHRHEFQMLLTRIRRGELVQHYETEWLRKDGQRIQVSLTFSPLRDSRRKLVGFVTIARDVTEERRMKALLTSREHELQDMFDEASVGLLLADRDGTILRANHAFHELLGRAPGRIIGQNLRHFHPDTAWIESALAQLAVRQTLHNAATELLARDGRPRPVLVDANALWEKGQFIHSRWFVRDISRRKELEHELLELSERERRRFAQELHDGLGQQLGGVAYLANVLREKLAERDAPESADAARIFGLVRDAIEQTRRISRGLSPIRPEPDGLMMALRELARQTTEVFHVHCRVQCRQPVLVEDAALAGHLFRIAQEAVNNALKHAKPRSICITLSRAQRSVVLAVADDGKGIGVLSPTRHGLGLHIMQYRAGLIQGTVSVQPRRGGGTEVVCVAPCASPKTGPRPK